MKLDVRFKKYVLCLFLFSFSFYGLSEDFPYIFRRSKEGLLDHIALQIIKLRGKLNETLMRCYLKEEDPEKLEEVRAQLRQLCLNDVYYDYLCRGLKQERDPLRKRCFYFLKLYFDFIRISLDPEVKNLRKKILEVRK